MRRDGSINEERPQGTSNLQTVYSGDWALFSAYRAKCRRIQEDIRYSTPPPRAVDVDMPPPSLRSHARRPSWRHSSRTSVDDARRIMPHRCNLAAFPIVDHDLEPPLCYAARMGSINPMPSLMRSHGASWSDIEASGPLAAELALHYKKHLEASTAVGYGFQFSVDL
eukprot:TRINITY_DN23246_c0_g1_i1.p1 TRINITY_DN23246_c0_g1~~TRINITY_DN23246_c0_g1_i1.p1  ORF type:complete len:177 (-),score=32.92 TRINITY_DN23246_c0_g1_i1:393-893(-)